MFLCGGFGCTEVWEHRQHLCLFVGGTEAHEQFVKAGEADRVISSEMPKMREVGMRMYELNWWVHRCVVWRRVCMSG